MTDLLVERARPALAVALPHALGVELADPDDPTAGVGFTVAGLALTPHGGLHAAALGAVAELAGYLAVLPTLDDGEHAVTHASATQLPRAAHEGDRVHVVGTLDKRGRAVAFVSVTAWLGPGLLARTQLTKSVVAAS